jgi:tetratricopeptide (TPR) repeat protein
MGISRSPGFIQYFGKVFLPFNLSVVPFVDETTVVYGIISILLIVILLVMNKQRDNKLVLFGAGWFVLTLFPFFLAPNDIHGGLFEHRLYIPMIGLILVTREAIAPVLNFFSKKVGSPAIIFFVVIAVFGITTFTYSDNFANEIVFYKDGIEHSPGSAYLNRMMGVRLLNRGKEDEAIPYFRKAYQLDPKEPFVRYFEAKYVYLPEDSLAKAKELLEGEAIDNPTFPDTYFELAHIAFEQHDKASERKYLEKQLELQPKDEVVNNNLLKLYIDSDDKAKAQKQIEHMQSVGLTVDNTLTSEVNAMH